MRSDQRRRLGVLLSLAALWGAGCKKEQPQASMPVDAGAVAVAVVDAGPVAKVVKPLRLSDVSLQRQEDRLAVKYTLTNPGTAQARGPACLMLIDEGNRAIDVLRMGGITVKGGSEDTFEDQLTVADLQWKQARAVLLFTVAYDKYCSDTQLQPTSETLRLLPTGAPAPAGLPMPVPAEEATAADLVVSDVRVRRSKTPAGASVTFTVKNVSDHRASGSACLRAYVREGLFALEENDVGEFDLAPGASATVTGTGTFGDASHWDEVTVLRLFTHTYGCAEVAGPENPGVLIHKPVDAENAAGGEEAQHDAE
ncbi:hypothetical protein D7X96_36890 [Corallococcus interemptor]|uniref:Lipoprotein n=1 Tax=Corallococcus interemptor TaxID=2316720 RepID=A0A3A8PU35_9BACT|nr:hypothetical protein [Corallococcus interemptor]RKH58431.1 hypothetical protein D7X96_36890 [Corallococcus interemptor]